MISGKKIKNIIEMKNSITPRYAQYLKNVVDENILSWTAFAISTEFSNNGLR